MRALKFLLHDRRNKALRKIIVRQAYHCMDSFNSTAATYVEGLIPDRGSGLLYDADRTSDLS